MKGAGIALMIAGITLAVIAFAVVDTDSGGIHNIGMLQTQNQIFLAGLTLALMGAILFAAGSVLEAMQGTAASAANAPETFERSRPLAQMEWDSASDTYQAPVTDGQATDGRIGAGDKGALVIGAAILVGALLVTWIQSGG